MRMKMFQLKMYMATSGRAPERGLPAQGRQLPTLPGPACPGSRCCPCVTSYLCASLNLRTRGVPCAASMLPLRAGTQISEVGRCTAACVGTEAWQALCLSPAHRPVPLPPCTLPSVGGSGRRGEGCQFHFPTPFCENPCHFLYLFATRLLGPNVRPSSWPPAQSPLVVSLHPWSPAV